MTTQPDPHIAPEEVSPMMAAWPLPVAPQVASPVNATVAAQTQPARVPWLLLIGSAVAALGVAMPWVRTHAQLFGATIDSQGGPSGGGLVLLLAPLIAVVWIGWAGQLSHSRRVAMAMCAAGAALLVFFVYNGLTHANDAANQATNAFQGLDETADGGAGLSDVLGVGFHRSIGIGLWVYAAGLAVVWIGVLSTWAQTVGRGKP